MAKELKLTQGKVALVDDEDFEWANQWKWHAHRDGHTWYARRSGPSPERRLITLHREIALRAGLPFSARYDHIDLNGLNNKRQNIRPCTCSQNRANSRKRADCASRFKGVYWDRESRKWRAQIRVNTRIYSLGRFCSEIEAAQAYKKAAHEAFGEFARV